MKTFKYILISSIIIFIITIPAHFMFGWLPFKIIALFFPTNESIFQHMKMIFTSFFLFYLFLIVTRKKLDYHNLFFSDLISSLTCIISFLIIYLPIYIIFGENMIFTFILLFLSIAFGQFISTYIIKKDDYQNINILSIIIIIIIFVVNAYFTYNPIIDSMLFYDPKHKTYDIVYK